MRLSRLFTKTSKTVPQDADSVNAQLLTKGGYVDQLMAGVYTMLPLGLRTLDKIKNIIREEMDAMGGQEMLMPALLPKEPWEITGRWSDPGPEVMFQFKGRGDKEYGLGWTHEEIITPLAKHFIHSYKDLPFAVYQIQDKFRNEPRAKSGLLRCREFSMKDLYSFHRDVADLEAYYEKTKQAYLKVFERCGLHALVAEASGGAFSKYSHEFQVLAENGEDTIFYCGTCEYAQNKEISQYHAGDKCPQCGGKMKESKAIEVGNIFQLKNRFTEAFGVNYTDADGSSKPVQMGCYGIGPTRVMGAIVEHSHDERGIMWPKSVTPFHIHLVSLNSKNEDIQARITDTAETLYEDMKHEGMEVIWDDRDASPGEKLADADLLGMPLRILISEKTLKEDSVEWKLRSDDSAHLVKLQDVMEEALSFVKE